jgi:hypothetical protein
MQLDSIKGIAITLAFLVPGYVWSATLSYFIPRRTKDAALSLLEFFTFSCVNAIFWLLLCLAIPPLAGVASHPIWVAVVAFIAFFVTPFGFGWLLGRFSPHPKVASALKIFGWKPVRSVPTAWDYWFGLERPAFLSVTMTDGSKVHGYFGSGSFAGDGTDERRDIYIERVYCEGQEGFKPVDRTAGILVSRSQIAYLEFYNAE